MLEIRAQIKNLLLTIRLALNPIWHVLFNSSIDFFAGNAVTKLSDKLVPTIKTKRTIASTWKRAQEICKMAVDSGRGGSGKLLSIDTDCFGSHFGLIDFQMQLNSNIVENMSNLAPGSRKTILPATSRDCAV